MKCGFFILLAVLVLAALGQYLFKRFVKAPEISAVIDLGKALTERKILYTVVYSGVVFRGVYEIGGKKVQDKTEGNFRISTVKKEGIFGIQLFKKKELVGEMVIDIYSQKILLNNHFKKK